jgi:ubiquinone/menaquinone biosynthesis C-methylase UbiE
MIKHTTEEVAKYYDDYTDTYLQTTGDFIQSYRSDDTDTLMEYLVNSMGLHDGMSLLDAGCGVCAPAIWIAHRFPNTEITCITNSEKQYTIAIDKIRSAGITKRITLIWGDYHHLQKLCPENKFDLAIFLESLGHSNDLRLAIGGINLLLKPGGSLYIKDFFKRYSNLRELQKNIDEVVEIIDRNYSYNVMDLPELIESILSNDFSLNYIRPPNIISDLGITVAFEDTTGRLTYPSFSKIKAIDWYEILATINPV